MSISPSQPRSRRGSLSSPRVVSPAERVAAFAGNAERMSPAPPEDLQDDPFPLLNSKLRNAEIEQLRLVGLFRPLSDDQLDQLRRYVLVQKFPQGHIVCGVGDPPDGFYVIVRGIASVYVNGLCTRLAMLKTGNWFGELALLEDLPRTATIQCTYPCEMLFVPGEVFGRFLSEAPSGLADRITATIKKHKANHLKSLPFFQLLKKKTIGPRELYDEGKLAQLGDLFIFAQKSKGTVLFSQGDVSDGMYVVSHGTVQVSATDEQDLSDVLLTTLGAGEWFGEVVPGERLVRPATVTASTDTILLFLKSENFAAFLDIVPELSDTFSAVLERRSAQNLKSIPLFASLNEDKPWSKMDLLAGLFMHERVAAGQVLFSEGDMGEKFYIVVSGTVSVFGENASSEQVQLATLGPGDWFGEIALMATSQRTATVTVNNQPCHLLSLTADRFRRFLRIAPELQAPFEAMVRHRAANTLRTIPLFDDVSDERLDQFGALFNFESLPPDTVVYHQGDPGDKFYVIVHGTLCATVNATLLSPDRNRPGERQLGVMRTGDWFGEAALLEDSKRNNTVTTRDHCVLLSLSHDQFERFCQVDPKIQAAIEQGVQKRRLFSEIVTSPMVRSSEGPAFDDDKDLPALDLDGP